jgi:hypothetical protein
LNIEHPTLNIEVGEEEEEGGKELEVNGYWEE